MQDKIKQMAELARKTIAESQVNFKKSIAQMPEGKEKQEAIKIMNGVLANEITIHNVQDHLKKGGLIK
ncbi:MAG: hypothetical protein AAF740_01790 [Bacteroidota bacterium]